MYKGKFGSKSYYIQTYYIIQKVRCNVLNQESYTFNMNILIYTIYYLYLVLAVVS